jgi:hypothetical protein
MILSEQKYSAFWRSLELGLALLFQEQIETYDWSSVTPRRSVSPYSVTALGSEPSQFERFGEQLSP